MPRRFLEQGEIRIHYQSKPANSGLPIIIIHANSIIHNLVGKEKILWPKQQCSDMGSMFRMHVRAVLERLGELKLDGGSIMESFGPNSWKTTITLKPRQGKHSG